MGALRWLTSRQPAAGPRWRLSWSDFLALCGGGFGGYAYAPFSGGVGPAPMSASTTRKISGGSALHHNGEPYKALPDVVCGEFFPFVVANHVHPLCVLFGLRPGCIQGCSQSRGRHSAGDFDELLSGARAIINIRWGARVR
jgi:hypothetical protein